MLPEPPKNIRSSDSHIGLADFYAVPGSSQYMYMPTRELWPKESVDSILPLVPLGYKRNGKEVKLKPTVWLKQRRRVEQVTWVPGLPEIIEDRLLFDGGWKAHHGAHGLNLYRPPQLVDGDATKATPWIEHVRLLYPEDAEATIDWFAHRVQRPHEKINHALVLGGKPGIGKDWLLQALKLTVGPWNWHEVSPTDPMSPYTPFVKAVVLRMNEGHDLGDSGRADRFALYERTKTYAAAPPDVLACSDKYIRRFYVPNILGLVITTNHKTDGIHVEADDRRHLVAWSDRTKEEFPAEFWNERWGWLLQEGGAGHVAAFLAQRDLKAFDPCAVPRQTAAFFEIVNASTAPEDADIADALDDLDRPAVCSIGTLVATPRGASLDWMTDLRRRRSIPYRLERSGYVACKNPDAHDGLWRINGRRQSLYVRADLPPAARLQAARVFMLEQTKTTGTG